jgi:hypothetical protein
VNRRDLDELVSRSEWPSVSIIAPLSNRAPDNQQNEIRVKSLVKQVREKLIAERVEEPVAKRILERLDSLIGEVDLFTFSDVGVAFFVSPGFARRVDLPFEVRERAVVDRVFATREIVVGLERGLRWRAVIVGMEQPRILDGFRERVVDVARVGATDLIDEILSPIMDADPVPLVIVGLEPEIVHFVTHSRFAHEVILTIRGRYERTDARELGRQLWPMVEQAIEVRRRERIERELDSGMKRGRIVSGIEDVWIAAHQGRGDILIVEDNLHFPIEPGVGQRALLRAPAGLDIDNAVDEIVDVVLAAKGRVEFVAPGTLGHEHQGIVMVTRYAAVREVA